MSTTTQLMHVARQPILDARNQVYGYELLYRGTKCATSFDGDVTHASARMLCDVVTGPELEVVVGDKRAFVNLSGLTTAPSLLKAIVPDLLRRGVSVIAAKMETASG